VPSEPVRDPELGRRSGTRPDGEEGSRRTDDRTRRSEYTLVGVMSAVVSSKQKRWHAIFGLLERDERVFAVLLAVVMVGGLLTLGLVPLRPRHRIDLYWLVFWFAAYKGGIFALTKQAAMDLAPHKIRVNCIVSGIVGTPIGSKEMGNRKLEYDSIPLRRIGQPEEVGEAALFLASDKASYITNAVLAVDGGRMNSMGSASSG